MKRSLLFYFGTAEGQVVPWHFDDIDINKPVGEVLCDLAKANNAIAGMDSLPILSTASSDYELFDWESDAVSPSTPVRRLARPGVLFAVHKDIEGPAARAHSLKFFTLNQKDPRQAELLQSFLQGPRGDFAPREYDVFITYSEADAEIAHEIMDCFGEHSVSCFMAKKAIKTGVVWEDRIRTILSEVLAAVVIITPNSVSSKWVMCEAGALWVLRKPLFPALMFAEPRDLPELIAKHQARDIRTSEGRRALCEDVVAQCRLA